MSRYFLIVENVNEVFELGEFESIIEAEREDLEHYSHGERCVIVAESQMRALIDRIELALNPNMIIVNATCQAIAEPPAHTFKICMPGSDEAREV